MKEITLSKRCGFCMGVKNAFTTAIDVARTNTGICCYGEIVHNKFALQALAQNGITIIDDIQDIINNNSVNTVIIRAHGISPDEESTLKHNKNTIDLTCKKVKQVQMLSQKLASEGFLIIILGKKNHPEVKGICGYCKGRNIVIRNIEDLKQNLDMIIKEEKIAFISQTTANPQDFDEISEFLKENQIGVIYNTLCRSPMIIQEETISLAKKSDIMIIIGDHQSANTTTLFDLSKKICITKFVETIKDLSDIDFTLYNKIGVSAGSSTPNSQIDSIIIEIKSLIDKSC